MKRSSSVSAKIKFAHVAKDGKDGRTAIYNATLKKWVYEERPSDAQMSASVDRLMQIDNTAFSAGTRAEDAFKKADSAFVNAEDAHTAIKKVESTATNAATAASNAATAAKVAKDAADEAHGLAESKVTAQEATDAVRVDVFELDFKSPIGHPKFRSIEFQEDTERQGAFTVWLNFGEKGASSSSATRGWLDYARNEDVDDLWTEINKIKAKLGM